MTMVYIPAPLRDMCGGIATLDVQAPTLDALLRALDLRCPGFYARVVEDGRVRPELAVAIDGEAATYPLSEPVSHVRDLTIIPHIGGGQ
jgi:molybdopterin synthase sulfur carrier subunit